MIRARSVIVATGVTWRELDVPGADGLVGRGIYYGAARTEALDCAGQHVFLVGGGNSAGQAAMFFANYARRVSLLVRGASLASSMSHYLIEQLATKGNIEVCTHCRIEAVSARAGTAAFGALLHYIAVVSAIGLVVVAIAYLVAWTLGRVPIARIDDRSTASIRPGVLSSALRIAGAAMV